VTTMKPPKQSPTLRLRCRINKRLIKKGTHNRSLMIAVQGQDHLAHPSYIHTYVTSNESRVSPSMKTGSGGLSETLMSVYQILEHHIQVTVILV
jgi:hypothetical protein